MTNRFLCILTSFLLLTLSEFHWMPLCAFGKNEGFSHKVQRAKKAVSNNRPKAKTIILDPGHGGIYFGQVSIHKKLIEKNMALDIAQRVAYRLRKRGYNVILTRTKDTEFDKKDLIHDLALRANYAEKYGAHAFVSLHLNGSRNKEIRGYEVYVPYENKYPIRSYKLACSLHYELSHKIAPVFGGGTLGNLNNIDHGIKASKFNVLIKAQCPAVLIELDYLTNAEAEKMLETVRYRDRLAHAVYCGIRRYFER